MTTESSEGRPKGKPRGNPSEGGKTRAAKLSPERRREIASIAFVAGTGKRTGRPPKKKPPEEGSPDSGE